MGLGAKNQNDVDVCALAEILKEEDDDEDDASEKKRKERILIMIMKPKLLMREKNDVNETKATDEILKKIITEFLKY